MSEGPSVHDETTFGDGRIRITSAATSAASTRRALRSLLEMADAWAEQVTGAQLLAVHQATYRDGYLTGEPPYFASGHCEVHPHIAEPWPCGICLVLDAQREQPSEPYQGDEPPW